MKSQHILGLSKNTFGLQAEMNAFLRLDGKDDDRLYLIRLAKILGNGSLLSIKKFPKILIKIHLLVFLAAFEVALLLLDLFLRLGIGNSGTQFLLFFAHD